MYSTHKVRRQRQLIIIAADVIYEESAIPLLIDTVYTSFRCFSALVQQHQFYSNENAEGLHEKDECFQCLLFYTPRALTTKQNVNVFTALVNYIDNVQE